MIRQTPELAGVRLVAHTGYGSPEDRQKARDAGFDAHLVKPAELGALVKADLPRLGKIVKESGAKAE